MSAAAELKVVDGDLDLVGSTASWIDSAGAVHPLPPLWVRFRSPFHRGWKSAVRPVEVIAPPEPLGDSGARMLDFLCPRRQRTRRPGSSEPHRFVLELRPEASAARSSRATMGLEEQLTGDVRPGGQRRLQMRAAAASSARQRPDLDRAPLQRRTFDAARSGDRPVIAPGAAELLLAGRHGRGGVAHPSTAG